MDKVEARSILEGILDELKTRAREELLGLIGNPICIEKKGQSGATYQIEYEALWDAEPGGDLRGHGRHRRHPLPQRLQAPDRRFAGFL